MTRASGRLTAGGFLASGFLAAFVVLLGIAIGGGLYEQLVVIPVWSSAPPDSVVSYYQYNAAHPKLALDQGGTFWARVIPLMTFSALGTALSGLRTSPEHRKWRIGAVVLTLALVVVTGAWFIPNIRRLLGGDVLTMPSDAVVRLTTSWVRLNWIRSFLFLLSWIAALRALTISPARTGAREEEPLS